jgi:hypothetical protein
MNIIITTSATTLYFNVQDQFAWANLVMATQVV